jgi:hypothetical protein
MKTSAKLVLIHLIGCLAFLTLPMLFAPGSFSLHTFFHPRTQQEFITYLLMVIFFYINYYLLIPRFYVPKKHIPYILFIIAFAIILITLPKLMVPFHPEHGGHPGPGPRHRFFNPFEVSNTIFLYLIIVFFSITLRINNQLKEARQEKLNAELSYLKAQINPHFLFNTLNSIYSLAIVRSEGTAAAIVKLSGMMRYVISESQHNLVSLEKETGYITDYIDLQKIRLGNSIKLNFTITGNTTGKQIAPLVLIPFIENAFKYGVNAEEDPAIRVAIVIDETTLKMEVENNKVTTNMGAHESGGLGIENTKGRLDLLYPSKHELVIRDGEHSFLVSLNLTLV